MLHCCSSGRGEAGNCRATQAATEHERAILARSGAEHDPIIIEALTIFNRRIVAGFFPIAERHIPAVIVRP